MCRARAVLIRRNKEDLIEINCINGLCSSCINLGCKLGLITVQESVEEAEGEVRSRLKGTLVYINCQVMEEGKEARTRKEKKKKVRKFKAVCLVYREKTVCGM